MSSKAMLLPDDADSDASGVDTVGYYLPDCNLPSAPSSAIFDSETSLDGSFSGADGWETSSTMQDFSATDEESLVGSYLDSSTLMPIIDNQKNDPIGLGDLAPNVFIDNVSPISSCTGSDSETDGLPSFPNIEDNPDVIIDEDGIKQHVCVKCQRKIENQGIFINGKYYHANCAICCQCRRKLDPPNCVMSREVMICTECWKHVDGNRVCSACGLSIEFSDMVAVSEAHGIYHTHCLSCTRCHNQITRSDMRIVDKTILCSGCAFRCERSLCNVCKKPIVGDLVRVGGVDYHKEHFMCMTCGCVLKGNAYVIHHNKAFCFEHGKIYLETCAYCKSRILGVWDEPIRWRGKVMHASCMKCRICGVNVKPKLAKSFHNRPHCSRCYQMRKDQEGLMKCKHHIPEKTAQMRRELEARNVVVQYPEYTPHEERFLTAGPKSVDVLVSQESGDHAGFVMH